MLFSKRSRLVAIGTVVLGLALGIMILGGAFALTTPTSASSLRKHHGNGHGHGKGNGHGQTTTTVTVTGSPVTVTVPASPSSSCGTAPNPARLLFGQFGPAQFVVVCMGLRPNQTYTLSSNLPAGCVATAQNGLTTITTDSAGNLTQTLTVGGGASVNCQQGTFNFALTSNGGAPVTPTQTVSFSETFTV